MKIVFMGTPEFSVPTLEKLYEKGHEIGYVVTQPDTPRDRGKKLKFTKVKEKALELGLEVLQPERVKENYEFFDKVREFNPDVIIVVAYGKVLPKEFLEIPKKVCINIHGSLLPKYRGAAPIQRAIWDGEKTTGITIMEMAEGLDTGDMINKEEVLIDRLDTGELFNKLSFVGADLLDETLDKLDEFLSKKEKQDDNKATYAKMIFKEDAKVDFSKSAEDIDCQIRALSPQPGAYAIYKENKIKLFSPSVIGESEEENNRSTGEILEVGKNGIVILTGKGRLIINEIQVSGKKRMMVRDYLAGNTIEVGEILK